MGVGNQEIKDKERVSFSYDARSLRVGRIAIGRGYRGFALTKNPQPPSPPASSGRDGPVTAAGLVFLIVSPAYIYC